MRFKKYRLRLLVTVILVNLAICAFVRAEEVILPDELFFYVPVASVFGQSAIWINPAALGQRQLGTIFMVSHRDDRIIRDWGSASTTRALGMAVRNIKYGSIPDFKEVVFSIGGGRQTAFGLSYRYIYDGPGYLKKRHLWNIGLLIKRSKNLSLGARIENLNRGRINGQRSDIKFIYGLAARAYQDLVTVTFDVEMNDEENLRHADFRTGIEVRPKPGMYIYADVDNNSRFGVGIRLNLQSNYGGHYSRFSRDGKNIHSTTYMGSVKGKQPSVTKPRKKSLVVNLDGDLPENPKIPFFRNRPLSYLDYIAGIYKAADDNEIDRLYLNIKKLKCGIGKIEELSEAVKYFRTKGKKAYAFIATPNKLGYLLASSTDTIIVPPLSQLELTGLRAKLTMYKGLLDKIGVEAEIERIDEFKSAAEPLIFDRPSEPYRQQVNRIIDKYYGNMLNEISANRGLPIDSLKHIIDRAPLTSIEAIESGLVDDKLYTDESLKKYAGSGNKISGRLVSFDSYIKRPFYDDRWVEPPGIGVIYALGAISHGESGGAMGDYEMLKAIRRVRLDDNIKGVVLRIDSPGGDALASDLIWHELELTEQKKPVVISMGNTAASGGYYITTINSEIYANRNTLTGSIGIFGGKINLSGLYDKLGIYTETISRGKNADMYSLSKPFTEEQREKLKDHLRQMYNHFTQKVSDSRSVSVDSVNALGRGQVWTGGEALDNGLIDSIGGIHQAIERVCELAGLDNCDVDIFTVPNKLYFFNNPFDLPYITSKVFSWLSGSSEVNTLLTDVPEGYINYRLPFNIEIE